eukprot:750176-Hanusia_phi.AAC.2
MKLSMLNILLMLLVFGLHPKDLMLKDTQRLFRILAFLMFNKIHIHRRDSSFVIFPCSPILSLLLRPPHPSLLTPLAMDSRSCSGDSLWQALTPCHHS